MEQHYLQAELEARFAEDPTMIEFLQRGSLDGVWYWDLEQPEHEWMSPEFWRLFGVDPATKQHLASEWQDIIFPEDGEVALANFERHCADPDHPYDQVVRYRHADGSTVWVRCRGLAIRDESGQPIRMLGAHNDLTAQKQLEDDLLLQVARTAAANEELAAFAYATSHDLKAPINTLSLLLSELAHELDDVDEEIRHLIELGRATARRAAALVEDVLDYTRVVGQDVEPEPVALADVAAEVMTDLAASISESGAQISLDLDGDAVVAANPMQVRLLLMNLLTNAIKFHRPGEIPTVRIVGRRDGPTVRLCVEDEGIGIDEAHLNRIFRMFERLHPRDAYDGAGLGLALCRRVVINHGGSIEVSSEVGVGTRFDVTLPSASAA